jgi:hypothetical protein
LAIYFPLHSANSGLPLFLALFDQEKFMVTTAIIKTTKTKLAVKPDSSALSQSGSSSNANEDLTHRIAEAAYYRAQARGFEPGHEMDDWLAAEAAQV